MERKDISGRDDIALLVNTFYEKVRNNAIIGYIFNDIAKVDWPHHLPVMYDFWENVVFQTGRYSRNAMQVHRHLNQLIQLNKEHFNEWLKLWSATVDELFEGKNAMQVKNKAQSIAALMQVSIERNGMMSPGSGGV